MKKIHFLKSFTTMVLWVCLASFHFVWGQGLETFDNATDLPSGSTYGDGSFVGNNGVTWNYVHAQSAGTYPIDGEGILLRRANEPSSLSATLSGGISSFTVDTRKGYTGNTQRRMELVINGDVIAQFEPTYPSGESSEVIPFTVNDINIAGNFTLELRLYGSSGNQHIVLDNISWTGFPDVEPEDPPVVTSETFNGTVGQNASFQIQATENPASYTLVSGTLPGGLNLNTSTGLISGIPDTAGNSSVSIAATNGAGTGSAATISFEIAQGTQTITPGFTNLTKLETDEPFDLPATTDQGITINYTSTDVEVATVSGNTVTIVGTGTTTIEAANAGNANYSAFNDSFTLTVAEEGTDTPVYGIGFEDSEGFTHGTTYNNTTVVFSGPTGQQWGTYYGTPSETGAISGGQSMQMRWYTNSASNLGYTFTNFDLANVTKVEFKAANTNGINVIVSRSTDGGSNWTNDETFVLSTSAETYTYHVSPTGEFANVRLRFQITYTTAPSATSRLYLDDVVVYSTSTPPTDPSLQTSTGSLSDFDYIEGEGPSASQSFEVSGLNMDGSEDVTLSVSGTDFEISLNDTDFSNTLTLVGFDGTATEIYARLKAGLAVNTYTATITVSGYDTEDITVNLSGEVTEVPGDFALPYSNGLRNADDIAEAEGLGFEFNGTDLQTGAGGYVRMPLNSNIVSASIDFSLYETILVSFDTRNYGGSSGQQLTVFVSENNGTDYTALGTFDVPADYETFIQVVDVSAMSGFGKIKFEMTAGTNQTRFRDLSMDLGVVWTAGNAWSNGTGPTIDDEVVILGNLVTGSDLEAKTLTVAPGGSLTILSGNTFTVNGRVTNQGGAGNFTIESGANLIQQTGTTADNAGAITVHRMNQPFKRLDYTMWSSPVQGQQIQEFSPETLPERIYTYEDDNYYEVGDVNADFAAGKGYLFRAPNNWSEDVPTAYSGVFSGVPFNGNISIPTHADGYTSIGNPYASNIDADLFLDSNPGVSTLYFWTNTNPVVDGSYSGNNYATYTLMGGAGTSGAENDESNAPNGSISAGQGFIVASTAANATFNNGMRASDTAIFFKTDDTERHRIWLDLKGETQGFNQILIGYMDGATNGVDNQIDGVLFSYEGSALYNLINEEKYTIQGRALPFESTDVVPLGFKAVESGSFTISMIGFDGLFADSDVTVYLKDYHANTLHNLSESDYAFQSEAGEFNDRFEVVYEDDGSMGVDELNSHSVQIYAHGQQIYVKSETEKILSVELYDLQGRSMHRNERVNANVYQVAAYAKGIVVVRVQTNPGKIITQKVIIQ